MVGWVGSWFSILFLSWVFVGSWLAAFPFFSLVPAAPCLFLVSILSYTMILSRGFFWVFSGLEFSTGCFFRLCWRVLLPLFLGLWITLGATSVGRFSFRLGSGPPIIMVAPGSLFFSPGPFSGPWWPFRWPGLVFFRFRRFRGLLGRSVASWAGFRWFLVPVWIRPGRFRVPSCFFRPGMVELV